MPAAQPCSLAYHYIGFRYSLKPTVFFGETIHVLLKIEEYIDLTTWQNKSIYSREKICNFSGKIFDQGELGPVFQKTVNSYPVLNRVKVVCDTLQYFKGWQDS